MADPSDLTTARSSLQSAAARSAQLIASLPDLSGHLPRSEWTFAEAAAHLAIALRAYTDAATGQLAGWQSMIPAAERYADRIGGLNRNTIAAEPARTPNQAAAAITDAAAAFLDATAGRSPSDSIPTPWYGDAVAHTILSATCLLLGEQLLHGLDMARGLHQRWPITSADARLVFDGIRVMMPIAFDPAAAGALSATFQLHVGRGSAFQVRINDRTATIQPAGTSPVDCQIAGTPIALMLLGYGRISQWRAIAGGRLIAWGRKPWLGFRFVGLFFNP